jgi:hypothetical protein
MRNAAPERRTSAVAPATVRVYEARLHHRAVWVQLTVALYRGSGSSLQSTAIAHGQLDSFVCVDSGIELAFALDLRVDLRTDSDGGRTLGMR